MAGIYVHIPFCKSKCIYCGFYSKPLSLLQPTGGESIESAFVKSVIKEIGLRKDFFNRFAAEEDSKIVNTIYFGGGTPSTLSISQLQRIKKSLYNKFDIAPKEEFTIEVNPDDVTPTYAMGLKTLGVNRISMGVQSFVDEHLKWMCRRHNAERAVAAFSTLRDAGFSNISLDLIFGFKGLTTKLLERNLEQLIALRPEHISTYQLSIDNGTVLEKLKQKGNNFLLGDSVCALQYALIQRRLTEAGYIQYEVSNFALKGYNSKHNSNYWNRTPYVGFGPGAHSFAGAHREWNIADVNKYIAHFWSKENVAVSESEELSEEDVFTEYIMLGLRRCDGVSVERLKCLALKAGRDLKEVESAIAEQIALGNLVPWNAPSGENRLKIPPEKLFVSDSIIRDVL